MYDRNSGGIEYIASSSQTNKNYCSSIAEFGFYYKKKQTNDMYGCRYENIAPYSASHSFTPEIFLNPWGRNSKLISNGRDVGELIKLSEQTFELMMNKELPKSISISVLADDEFRMLHSIFGNWSEGILGFSIKGHSKKVFVRENNLDLLMIVIGHEIGHVHTDTLPNKHDEEAKAFAFSIEWAKTIKKHDIAGLGMSIKEEFDFKPARNGLHDVALEFVIHEVRKGRSALELHKGLAGKYISLFNNYT